MCLAARDTLGIEIEVASADSEKVVETTDDAGIPHTAAETSALETEAPAIAEIAEAVSISGDTAAASGRDASVMPAHDLVVNWRGMHWDAARKTKLIQLLGDLRLPVTRSPSPAPAVVEESFQVPGSGPDAA